MERIYFAPEHSYHFNCVAGFMKILDTLDLHEDHLHNYVDTRYFSRHSLEVEHYERGFYIYA